MALFHCTNSPPGTYAFDSVTVLYLGTVKSLSPLQTKILTSELIVHYDASYDFADIPGPAREDAHVDVDEAGEVEGSTCYWHPPSGTCGCQDRPIEDFHSETECPPFPGDFCQKGPECTDYFADVCYESTCEPADDLQHVCKEDPVYDPVFTYPWQASTCKDQDTEAKCLDSKCYHFYRGEACPTGIKEHHNASDVIYDPCREGKLIVDEKNVSHTTYYNKLITEEKQGFRLNPYNVTRVNNTRYDLATAGCRFLHDLDLLLQGLLTRNNSLSKPDVVDQLLNVTVPTTTTSTTSTSSRSW